MKKKTKFEDGTLIPYVTTKYWVKCEWDGESTAKADAALEHHTPAVRSRYSSEVELVASPSSSLPIAASILPQL